MTEGSFGKRFVGKKERLAESSFGRTLVSGQIMVLGTAKVIKVGANHIRDRQGFSY